MKKMILLLILLLNFGCTSDKYQHDADILRVNHLEYIDGLVEEYKEKTGHYPFADERVSIPTYVFIATPKQIEWFKDDMPIEHITVSAEEFKMELESGLGRRVVIPCDPQKRGDSKPNFYMYMVQGKDYILAVHLHEGYGFGKKIGEDYYKVEVSSRVYEPNMIWSPKELFSKKEFKDVKSRDIYNPKYFEANKNELR